MGKVRIFCDCGKEIWDSPEGVVRIGRGWRINDIAREAICADCLMDCVLGKTHAAARLPPTP